MKAHLSQTLIDEFNLVKLRDLDGYPEYGFRDFSPDFGHLLWLYENESFGMAKHIYMNNYDTYFWWGYAGSVNFQTENEVRNHLYHLRSSIQKIIKEGKEKIALRKLIQMQRDFV